VLTVQDISISVQENSFKIQFLLAISLFVNEFHSIKATGFHCDEVNNVEGIVKLKLLLSFTPLLFHTSTF